VSRPRFLADHDLNEHIVEGVNRREPALEIVRAREVGVADRLDTDVLQYAAEHGLIVISHDVNTMTAAAYARLAAQRPVVGLFLVHQRDPVGPIIDDLILIWSATEAHEWQSQACFLPIP